LFIHFTEPVARMASRTAPAGTSEPSYTSAALGAGNVYGATGLATVTDRRPADQEFLATTAAWSVEDLAKGTTVALNDIWDKAAHPHDYSTDETWLSYGRQLPAPYNAYGTVGQALPGSANWWQDWPNPIAAVNSMVPGDHDAPTTVRRATDVLISVPPS
jgi:hypothetical protein